MKLDDKKRKIQMKYRDKVEQKNNLKKNTLELLIIIMIIFLAIILNALFPGF